MERSGTTAAARARGGGTSLLGWCMGLGLLLLSLAQLPTYLWQGYLVPKLIVLSVWVGLLLLALAFTFVRRRTEPLVVDWYTLAGVAFVLWSAVTAVAGPNPDASLLGIVFRYEGVLAFVAYLVVFLGAKRLASSRFMPGRLVLALGAVGISVIGLLAVLQHVWPADDAVGWLSLFWTARSQSTFTNPILLGLFACLVLPVLLTLLTEGSEGVEQPLLVVAASLIAAGAFLSFSRSFWVAAPIGCALALILAGPPQSARWRSVVPAAGFAGLCVVVALQVGGGSQHGTAAGGSVTRGAEANSVSVSDRLEETVSGGGSVRSRVELYRGALTLIEERPLLGRGFETYTPEAARTRTEALVRTEGFSSYADRPHNSLLYIAYATGLPGLVFYLLFVAGALLAAFRGYRARTGSEKVLAAGLLGGAVAYLLAEQTVFSTIEVTPLFFAMLGWATASGAVDSHQDRDGLKAGSWWSGGITVPPRYVRVLPLVLTAGALAWAVVAVPRALDVAAADHTHYRLTSEPQDGREFMETIQEELQAAERDPNTSYYWNAAALMLASAAEQFQRPEELERAREVLEQGLRHLPGDPTLVVTLSDILFRSNRPSDVVALLEPYLGEDEYQADGHYNLGLVYLALDQPEVALSHLAASVRFNPQDADSHWYLGEAYKALGRSAEAESEQRTAASLDPEYQTGLDG